MKKILIGLAILTTIGCKNTRMVDGFSVVINIESNGEVTNTYTVENYYIPAFGNENPKFLGRKGLYNVGDTVRFHK